MKLGNKEHSEQEIKEAVASSTSMAGLFRKIELKKHSGNYRMMRGVLVKLNIDTSHFVKGTDILQQNRIAAGQKILTDEELFVSNSSCYSNDILRKRIFKNKHKEYICEQCFCGPTWKGKDLTLELDHIDGDSTNNQLSNLRFLCPNCHTQTPTYRGANKPKNKCADCSKDIGQKFTRCKSCAPKYRESLKKYTPRYEALPSREILEKEIEETNVWQTAKKYGVTDNGLRKHLMKRSV